MLPRPAPSKPDRLRRALLAVATLATAAQASAFCGFYVAKADAALFNRASKVVMVRDGERTVLTMANDYHGELEEFAIVVPVPVVLERDRIHVGDRATIDHLDAYTAPRLVEYPDPDPCTPPPPSVMAPRREMSADGKSSSRARSLGVTVEAEYTVGEYDIVILSARQSDGLETYLTEEGYRLPRGAARALRPYIRQGLKFFVAKVNLEEQARTGYSYLRPLQMAYESRRFTLPIRLGMLNAREPQDLIVFALTRQGRVETANYRTERIPSGDEIPLFVQDRFADFYRDTFTTAWKRAGRDAVFLEYFWNMGWCDPCAADPLSPEELRSLGVFWLDRPDSPQRRMRAPNVLVTRLHLRYDEEHFPEDLVFQETRDQANFQGRYVTRKPFRGDLDCARGRDYRRELRERAARQAKTLARLTGWSMAEIREQMDEELPAATKKEEASWWQRIWGD